MIFRLFAALGIVFQLSVLVFAVAPSEQVDYNTHIKPLLMEKCSACHGVLKQEAGLRLDAGEFVRAGSESGSVVDLEQPVRSLLLDRVSASKPGERMPPDGEGSPLTVEQIELVEAWIAAGATSPADEAIVQSPAEHWAYQIPRQSPLPEVVTENRLVNPIDRFIAESIQEHGLQSVPAAEPQQLVRRVYLDLLGLPPTPEQQDAYLREPTDEAWMALVDRLLEDPSHGEHWARHWMDVWRYSDWDGYREEVRGSQRHIWHWRDWIVQSLNEDKGYDQMVLEMLAADELYPDDLDALRATGFLVRNWHKSNRDIWLDATVEHTAKAFLGITLNCAKCHDHKYDPIGQREYYAFRAIFEPHRVRAERLPGEADPIKLSLPRAYDAELDIPTYLYLQGNEKLPDTQHPIAPAAPQVIGLELEVSPVALPTIASHPFLRKYIEEEELQLAMHSLQMAKDQLASASLPEEQQRAGQKCRVAETNLESLRQRWSADKARAVLGRPDVEQAAMALRAERLHSLEQARLEVMETQIALSEANRLAETKPEEAIAAIEKATKAFQDSEKRLAQAQLQMDKLAESAGEAEQLVEAEKGKTKKEAAAATDEQHDSSYTTVGTTYPTTSTGRRLALAKAIVDRRNPLAARVAINHIWMRHFGEPLVENAFDFGLRSPVPAQVKLLDWLAVELMEHAWSTKYIHRLIVTSQTYRLSSSTSRLDPVTLARNKEIDPDNAYFWHAVPRRLTAESVRDSLLHVAGQLDRAFGGPDIDFLDGESNFRRSLYFRHAYEKQMTMLVLFDVANPTECYERSSSVVPQQALALANSPLSVGMSRVLAGNLSREYGEPGSFIQQLYRVVLGRNCSEPELALCLQFLQEQAGVLANPQQLTPGNGTVPSTVEASPDSHQRARENLVHVLLNHNDFVTVR
jgi:mono/diheme cytochrome c family protein